MQPLSHELVDLDLLVRVGSGSKVHVFRTHPRLQPVTDRLQDGSPVRAVALCGSRGEMVLVEDTPPDGDDDVCGTCARMIRETAARRQPAGRAAST